MSVDEVRIEAHSETPPVEIGVAEKGVTPLIANGLTVTELKNKNGSDPFFLARVTSLDDVGRHVSSWTVVVVEIDERTIAFNHVVPLTARRVIVTFEKRGMSTYSVEVELTWCRFDHPHLYTSGGRFVLPLGKTA